MAVLCLEIISDGPESIDKLYSWAIQEIDDVFIYTLSSQCLYIFIYNNFEITCIIAIKLSWHSAAMFRCNQNTKRDKTFFTPDLRYFVIRFPDSGQSQPEMAEIKKKGIYRMPIQLMYMPCGIGRKMFKTSQDVRTLPQRQSYESQKNRETSAKLLCDNWTTCAISESCRRNTARWSFVYGLNWIYCYCTHYDWDYEQR